jgi:opacity protein-like surface antigen
MMKIVMTVAVAARLCMSDAAAQSIVQKSDWQAKSFETYVAARPLRAGPDDVRAKPRKQDMLLNLHANPLQAIVLPCRSTNRIAIMEIGI